MTLAHLYKTIANYVPHKNILFVAFDREEQGLVGSRAMANAIKKDDIPQYCAMLNLDSFGLAGPYAMGDISSPLLIRLSEDVADELKLPFLGIAAKRVDSDSSSFIKKKIPALTLSGLSRDWKSILHSKNDQASRIQPADVHIAYRLALSIWERIDASPCDAFTDFRK